MTHSSVSVTGGYINPLRIFVNVNHVERMSEFDVKNVNEAYRMGINARPCAVERTDTTVTA
jgi:hypothetical protein